MATIIASCAEVKDQLITAVYILASTCLSTSHVIGSVDSRHTSSGLGYIFNGSNIRLMAVATGARLV